jgi:tetratricopeptide (TPR) repeat protein
MVALEISPAPKAAHIPHDAVEHLRTGNKLFDQGDFEGALGEYEEALRIQPGFPEALNNKGAALGQMGRLEAALEALREANRRVPDDALAIANQGLVHLRAGHPELALREFGRSIQARDNFVARNNRGTLLANLGRFDEALTDLNSALEQSPKSTMARLNRSGVFLSLGQLEDALDDVHKALQFAPNQKELQIRRRGILDAYLWRLVEGGEAAWSGGKPKGSKRPVKLTPGPPVSDYIVEERQRLRGA